ncbi:unnamed protein product [Notodromas monacha]|uniref:Ubiquitin carboxyl-terminal hydrolase 36 n=1 Tax=Notodromas monacha TaxID=399045 RepID=A0A7R9BPC6_9CRUS|nr:unnamed protein product [Notodromas monacha]CAG0917852.1 unnamed protein product [Notodromas monacha]
MDGFMDAHRASVEHNEIYAALSSKLKSSRTDGSVPTLDRLTYSSRSITEQRLQFVKREENVMLEELKKKCIILNPDFKKTSAVPQSFPKSPHYAFSGSPVCEAKPSANALFSTPPKAAVNNQNDEMNGGNMCAPKVVLYEPSKVKLTWEQMYPVGAGLVNPGLTCYLNSSLQVLMHCPPFVNWILSDPHCSANDRRCNCLLCAMANTVRQSHVNSGSQFLPQLILQRLRMISKTLRHDKQEDAHEFMRSLLSTLQLTYLKFRGASKLDVRSQETTPIDQIFGGYIRSQVICQKCNRKSNTFDHFQDLILDLRGSNTLDEALASYFKKETLFSSSGYKCVRCRTVVQASKKFSIEKPPNVLIIQLKRFESVFRKLSRVISFGRFLDLKPYSSWVDDSHSVETLGNSMKYALNGIVVHNGHSLSCGHYYAVAKASDGIFYNFNDSSVHRTSFEYMRNCAAYLLFYIRTDSVPFSLPNMVKQTFQPQICGPSASPSSSAPSNYHGSPSIRNSPSTSIVKTVYPKPIGPNLPEGFKVRSDASVNLLGLGKKSNESSRLSAGESPAVKTAIVPYDDDEEEDDPADKNELCPPKAAANVAPATPTPALDVRESSPKTPVVLTPKTPVVLTPKTPIVAATIGMSVILSTHKAPWSVDDDTQQTNRSDTSLDSVASTSGKWKVVGPFPAAHPKSDYSEKCQKRKTENSKDVFLSSSKKAKHKDEPQTDEDALQSPKKKPQGFESESLAERKVEKDQSRGKSECSQLFKKSTKDSESPKIDSVLLKKSKNHEDADQVACGGAENSSLHGFGQQVLSWNGGPNSLDNELARERFRTEERRQADREWDDEFDRGKEKKKKKAWSDFKVYRNGGNVFDDFQRQKRERGSDRYSGYSKYTPHKRKRSHGWGYRDDSRKTR